MTGDAYVEVVGREECLELLASEPVGWLAWCEGETPHMVPVNFAVDAGEVLIRTGYGQKLAAAAHGQVMTFGVSSTDLGRRTGWSVTATGRAAVVDDEDERAGAWLATPSPWAPGAKEVVIAIPISEISGRRVRRQVA